MNAPEVDRRSDQPRSQVVVRALAGSAGLGLLILAIACNALWESLHG
ncbi:hypothetical protein [Sphingomonas desiccabilis]|nr:hypothetical protein [Sphingomonas desiccabilis]MBB3910867.1 hypothetical protein [Sphingomonas desiccabilis]